MTVQAFINLIVIHIALPKLQFFATFGTLVVFAVAIAYRIIGFQNLKEHILLVFFVIASLIFYFPFFSYIISKLHSVDLKKKLDTQTRVQHLKEQQESFEEIKDML